MHQICSKQIDTQIVPREKKGKNELTSYYLRNTAIPFHENLCVELHERFSVVLRGGSCLLFCILFLQN